MLVTRSMWRVKIPENISARTEEVEPRNITSRSRSGCSNSGDTGHYRSENQKWEEKNRLSEQRNTSGKYVRLQVKRRDGIHITTPAPREFADTLKT